MEVKIIRSLKNIQVNFKGPCSNGNGSKLRENKIARGY